MKPRLPSPRKIRLSPTLRESWRARFFPLATPAALAALLLWGVCAAAAAAPDPPKKPKPEISARLAEDLFRKLDQVLQFVSDDTNLPIHHAIKKKLATRDQVEANLTQKMKRDEDAKRLERSEVVLKKFGLIPRDFHLREFMISMLREQVAGFYNLED